MPSLTAARRTPTSTLVRSRPTSSPDLDTIAPATFARYLATYSDLSVCVITQAKAAAIVDDEKRRALNGWFAMRVATGEGR